MGPNGPPKGAVKPKIPVPNGSSFSRTFATTVKVFGFVPISTRKALGPLGDFPGLFVNKSSSKTFFLTCVRARKRENVPKSSIREGKPSLRLAGLCLISCFLIVLPNQMAQASEAGRLRPNVEVVPAFGKDLPLSGQGYSSGAGNSLAAVAGWSCTLYASDPGYSSGTIEGEGFQACAGAGWAPQRIIVTIQRYLGLGFWQNKAQRDSSWVYIDFIHRDLIYGCGGTGSQLYRVLTNGYVAGGSARGIVQSQNYLRVTC